MKFYNLGWKTIFEYTFLNSFIISVIWYFDNIVSVRTVKHPNPCYTGLQLTKSKFSADINSVRLLLLPVRLFYPTFELLLLIFFSLFAKTKVNKKTLCVVAIAMIYSNLASLWTFQYFRRPVYNPVEHLWWSFYCNNSKLLSIFTKKLHHRCLLGSKHASAFWRLFKRFSSFKFFTL